MTEFNQHIMASWQQTVSEAYVGDCEQVFYDEKVADLFGFNALQVGGALNYLHQSRVAYRFIATSVNSKYQHDIQYQLVCEDDFLPFPEMSIDVLLLPRRLEFSPRPHQTLREAFRVLVPDGYVLITGFNPLSLWGLKGLIKRLLTRQSLLHYPWHGRLIRLARLKDWMSVLGFEIQACGFLAHAPPVNSPKWLVRFKWLERLTAKYLSALGGMYYIVAKKRVVGLTPIKPKWQAQKLTSVLAGQKNKNMPSQKNSPNENVKTHE